MSASAESPSVSEPSAAAAAAAAAKRPYVKRAEITSVDDFAQPILEALSERCGALGICADTGGDLADHVWPAILLRWEDYYMARRRGDLYASDAGRRKDEADRLAEKLRADVAEAQAALAAARTAAADSAREITRLQAVFECANTACYEASEQIKQLRERQAQDAAFIRQTLERGISREKRSLCLEAQLEQSVAYYPGALLFEQQENARLRAELDDLRARLRAGNGDDDAQPRRKRRRVDGGVVGEGACYGASDNRYRPAGYLNRLSAR
jgi:hypothetical protein